MLAVPMQQVANVVRNHPSSLVIKSLMKFRKYINKILNVCAGHIAGMYLTPSKDNVFLRKTFTNSGNSGCASY